MRARALIGIGIGLALAITGACSDGEDGGAKEAVVPAGAWTHARLEGVRGATALAAVDGRLLVATAGSRELRVVRVATVKEGAAVETRSLPLEVDPELHLAGSGAFAAQGYQVGDLWTQEVDLQGLAAHPPNFVFLAERNYRVIYAGRLLQAPDRSWRSLWIERVFTLPGADRRDASSSDWRDKGPGVVGLAAVKGERRTADLYVADAGDDVAGTFTILEMDRFGLALKKFSVELGGGITPDIGGILRDDRRYVVVRGSDRGTLHAVRDATWHDTIQAGRGVPGPEVEGGGPWRGMALSADGTWWLVSAGDPAILAWRRP